MPEVVTFQGETVTGNFLPGLWTSSTMRDGVRKRGERITQCQGMRRKTWTVDLHPNVKSRHPDVASWVIKTLPERRTIERDLIAASGAVEPTYSRTATGLLDRDKDNAEQLESYMNTWREDNVPHQTFIEKAAEDGEFGVIVIPTAVDMEGDEDFYDRLDDRAYAALSDEEQATYQPDDADVRGRYVKVNADGHKQINPTYQRDRQGKPKAKDAKGFTADHEKSREAHQDALRRYLLKQEQGACTVRVVPALDCIPFLTRGTKRERWKLYALLERTLYSPEELLQQGYNWEGMGNSALIPRGFDPLRSTGQNGAFYVYTLYLCWTDPDDPKKIRRPLILYSVGGQATSYKNPGRGQQNLPGIALLDLYELYGLEGPLWGYFGGLHTSDDDADYYYEPAMWPLVETIRGLEGMITSVNLATAVNSFLGYWHNPDAALVGPDGVDPEALIDASTNELRKPKLPGPGEVETTVGTVIPAQQAMVGPDAWRMIQSEYASLRANTSLDAPATSRESGHQMVVRENIQQTSKRHIREGAASATRFCGETALRIFCALSKTFGINWPLQTTTERPVGSDYRTGTQPLEFDPAWVGDGEYQLGCEYPSEANPVEVEQETQAVQLGLGSIERLFAAKGITDVETEWANVLKTRIRMSPAYIEAQTTRLAKMQGNKLMLQVLKLQKQQRMTEGGPPGFEAGYPTAAMQGPGEGQPGVGQTQAAQSLAGQKGGQMAAPMNDARAQMALPGQGGVAA